MRKVLGLRITRWPLKLAAFVALILVRYVLVALLALFGVPALAVNIIDSIVTLAGILLGARIFRGKGESVASTRPWWQMTAWPTLSRRLGISLSIFTVFGLIYVVLLATGIAQARASSRLTLGECIASISFTIILGGLYLHSAIRQTRAGVIGAPPVVTPTFRPTTRLR